MIDGEINSNYSKFSDLDFAQSFLLSILLGQLAANAPNQMEIDSSREEKLIIEKLPRYFIINHKQECKIEEIRNRNNQLLTTLIFVPDFSVHKKAFQLDLRTMDVKSILF